MPERVLIADDSGFMRRILSGILTKAGYMVVAEAKSGREAISKFQRTNPDIVTMDLTMPDVDGLEALKVIKIMDPTAIVIIVSAMGQEGIIREALRAGANDFLLKPFRESQVLKTCSRLLNSRNQSATARHFQT